MDKTAFAKLYEELSDAIFRYCFFRISDRERAKEITQEAFMKTWEYTAKDNEIQNVRAFIYKVARNLTINETTRRKKTESLEVLNEEIGFDPADEPATSIEEDTEINLLKEHIRDLGELDADMIIMKYINGMSVLDIAETLKMRENTVSVRLHRAIAKLKKIYDR